MAGHESDAVRQAAMRHRDAGRRRAADARADTRDDAEADAGRGERQRLLAATAEYQRIAALQPHHADDRSRASSISRSLMRSCGVRVPPARLPTGSRRAGRQRQDLGRDQRVVQHDIGLGKGAARRAA